MTKVDFSKLEIKGIDGSTQRVNIQDEVANLIYMQGQSIQDCELGRRIYQSGRDAKTGMLPQDADRTVELSDDELKVIAHIAQQFPYVIRIALDAAIK